MTEREKTSRRKQCILQAVSELLSENDYSKFTIEEVAHRAGVGKSTIYRWWKHRSDLIFDTFKEHTAAVFNLNFELNLRDNLIVQLSKLSTALDHPVGRALLVVLSENREAAGLFFHEYLLPRREEMRKLLAVTVQRGEIKADYPFEMMLDTLYGPIHYQMIFFNRVPDQHYIEHLVDLVLAPALSNSCTSS